GLRIVRYAPRHASQTRMNSLCLGRADGATITTGQSMPRSAACGRSRIPSHPIPSHPGAAHRRSTAVVSQVPDLLLNNGQPIPQLGFGVFLIRPEDTAEAVGTALEVGYRHIDTAQAYGNEAQVGDAIAKAEIPRSDVFVTSKLNNASHRPDDARRAFDQTLKALGFDYIDLFLIHWPLPMKYDGDYVSTWQTLGEFYRDGRARSIGVSNFQAHHLRRLHTQSDIPPAVNQIEVNPFLTQDDLRVFCREHQIAVEAWSPLARGGELLNDPEIRRIAKATGRSAAQVILRWHIERG